MAETDNAGVMSLTVALLSAYFANNTVPSGELPVLVERTRRALLGDAAPAGAGEAESKAAHPQKRSWRKRLRPRSNTSPQFPSRKVWPRPTRS
jgi:predicted transcriptional regulator